MSDFEPSQPGAAGAPTAPGNVPEYTVTELSLRLKRSIEDNFGWVRVRGEISGFKRAASGHLYFSLKDADSLLDGVCWKGSAARLGVKPEDGMEVICSGKLTSYPGRSKYQMVVERMELAGLGALMALLEQRKQKLAAEGLFAAERKRPLPYLPRVIGVVTSPTGAVIRDILHRLADRFPTHVLVWPVLVQGEGAAEQVAKAIRGFNALPENGSGATGVPRPDLLIVARGGGSLEDLMAFNEEVVVRAAAASDIPLISAVGHETDTTLIDFASDRRAPTPTAAAEMAVPVRLDLVAGVAGLDERLRRSITRMAQDKRRHLDSLGRGLRGPREQLDMARQRFDDLSDRLRHALRVGVAAQRARMETAMARLRPALLRREVAEYGRRLKDADARLLRAMRQRQADAAQRLSQPAKLLESLSYRNVLARGFAVIHGADGTPLNSADAMAPGAAVAIEMHDGRRDAQIVGGGSAPPVAKKAAPAAAKPTKQESLF
ncbi:exodeoxyribonuclease VII large subunit [Ferrovibrio terrae]|uniref:Exodeoxyribonuclease 7 large subunit n=1 Tax=Ferrovibrio terrae TaxID=2594003 RepID=A0A516GWB7_9PROT|nr:exodeoxyribonuclease VII large subunit [Ferrovibrio terrae]QDO95809.1 exodeoxyribonuclease VII large subunit [Ferrovibrio terrae]